MDGAWRELRHDEQVAECHAAHIGKGPLARTRNRGEMIVTCI